MANFAYLSEADRERLRLLPFPVALPRELPHGWKAGPLELFEDQENDEISLDANFTGPDSAQWSVANTPGGIGDTIPGEDEASHKLIQHPDFGQILVHFFREEKKAEVLSDWFPEVEDASAYHSFRGSDVSESDLKSLIASLAPYSAN